MFICLLRSRRECAAERAEGEEEEQFPSTGTSYRLVQSLREGRAAGGGDLPADCVGVVLAAAARAFQTVVAPLAKFEAPQGREVAAEAGHED